MPDDKVLTSDTVRLMVTGVFDPAYLERMAKSHEALRTRLIAAESLSEERRIGWVKQSALSAEVAVRLGEVTRERDAALAQVTVLARAGARVKHLILGGWHEPLCPVGDPCAGCQVRHALAAPLVWAALAQPFGEKAKPEAQP